MMGKYQLKGDVYQVQEYDKQPPFSSFLPGLAGRKGVPLWVYYTNRGQGVNSFGIHHKNNAIMEFNPANTAYENTSVKGFRTFVRCNGSYFEAFSGNADRVQRNFYIRKNSFWIEEINQEFGLKITVKYFVLPGNSIGALVRRVTFENLDSQEKELELLDGLPKIIPYGITNSSYKEMSNLFKSWTEIKNIEHKIPYYTMRASSDDSAEVSDVEGGYYYLGIKDGQVLPVIYDAEVIFDYETSLLQPVAFLKASLQEVMKAKQCFYNKVPCGFTPLSLKLKAGESCDYASLTGFAGSPEQINEKIEEFCTKGFLDKAEAMADELVDELTADIRTHSGVPLFDQYMEQNYLDNFLRGGYPFVFGKGEDKSVVHLFSRKHGDPERDYNFFSIAGEYYSQGNGNFRDVSQNRRNDVFFHHEIGAFNIKTFFELIQIDGYNPLEVRPSTFSVKPERRDEVDQLIDESAATQAEKLKKIVHKNFTPGQVSNCIAKYRISLEVEEDAFVEKLLSYCTQNIEAGFGEGYWSDHWNYNMDLIDDYLRIFPEKEKELLFSDPSYRFYDSPARVLPRSEKYVINNKNEVRQYGALVHDEEKLNSEGFDKKGTNWLKTSEGSYLQTTLMGKLLTLAMNKFSCLDPYGMGIEMEGGKPGWNDAMNGLPGLIGSGMAETFELKRVLTFVCSKINLSDTVMLPKEVASFITSTADALSKAKNQGWSDFTYWDSVASLRERFRDQVRMEASGESVTLKTTDLKTILEAFLEKINQGIEKACTYGAGIVPTYFTYQATEFTPVFDETGEKVISGYGLPEAVVKAFEVNPLPAFLEGPAKMLATLKEPQEAEKLYDHVQKSELYDRKLGMYKTSVPIEHISMENGRIRAFTPGWLERESIFLHMEYKYLLSMLRAGLYDQFYRDIKTCMVVFRDPKEYGRSILENSSFLASSANPNESIHGRGFVARLTGSTTEAITMWIEMLMGDRLFTWEKEVLSLHFMPKLAGWMFDEQGAISFTLFSNCRITYHNPSRKNTFGTDAAQIRKIIVNDTGEEFLGASISGNVAEKLREGSIKEVEVFME